MESLMVLFMYFYTYCYKFMNDYKENLISCCQFQQLGDWDRMHCEQINATRLIKQLKALIYEMDMLRSQVQDSDLQMFDRLTDQARKNAQDAIEEYLGK
jgi:syntaxin 17